MLSKHANLIVNRDIVLIASACQLQREGLVGYIGSYIETVKQVRLGNRKDGTVLPALFVLLNGSNDPQLLRSIIEFHAWVRISGADADGVLNDSFGVIEHHIRSSPGSRSQTLMSVTYKIPLNLGSNKESCVISTGITNLPAGVMPVTEPTERLIVTALLRNLRETFNTNLDIDPVTCRSPTANSPTECWDIGGAHADRIVAQMRKEGVIAEHLDLPYYRLSTLHAGKVKQGLASRSISASTVIVIQLFDNGLFMTATDEGELMPLRRDPDGKVHSDGDLTLAPKELQWKMFKQLHEELVDHKDNMIVFLAPLPRFLDEPCCTASSHMKNFLNADYKKKLEESVFQSRTNIKDFAFRLGYRRTRTLSTWGIVKKAGATWADQHHLADGGYSAITRAVLDCKDIITNKRKGKEDTQGPEAKKPRTEAASRGRQSTGGERSETRGQGGAWRGMPHVPNHGNHNPNRFHSGEWYRGQSCWTRGQPRRTWRGGRRFN
jgi:hypothetical protein